MLLYGEDQKKNGLIKQFLKDVNWGDLDYLIIDTPPGTSDEHLSIVQYLKNTENVEGAVIVTTPQEVSLQDVRKEINFCKKVKLPIIGVVENMSWFICPKCKTETKIFVPTTGGAEKMCKDLGLNFLGRVPIDPVLARSCDEGESYLARAGESQGAKAFREVYSRIVTTIESNSKQMDTS